jgi:hypothetical protein
MIMNKIILREALRVARVGLSTHPEIGNGKFYHWAFVVQNNKIIGNATNNLGIAPVSFGYHNRGTWIDFKPKRHAEYNAYTKFKGLINKNKNWEMINIRLKRNGDTSLSAPCNCCYDMLKYMGCSKCYFSLECDDWAKTII